MGQLLQVTHYAIHGSVLRFFNAQGLHSLEVHRGCCDDQVVTAGLWAPCYPEASLILYPVATDIVVIVVSGSKDGFGSYFGSRMPLPSTIGYEHDLDPPMEGLLAAMIAELGPVEYARVSYDSEIREIAKQKVHLRREKSDGSSQGFVHQDTSGHPEPRALLLQRRTIRSVVV